MLTINLLPWRDHARLKQKKIFQTMTILTFMMSFIAYVLIYHHLKAELYAIDQRIVVLTKKLEKFTNKSNHGLIELHNIVNKTRRHQDQLKKLLQAMLIHSNIIWTFIEVQQGVIKIYGIADVMTYLSSFIRDSKNQFDFDLVIKNMKILPPFAAIQFQIQMDKMSIT